MEASDKKYKTFREWNEQGYCIKKGEKARWIDGRAMFSLEQTTVKPPRRPRRKSRYSWQGGEWARGMEPDEMVEFTGEYFDPHQY